MFFACVCVLLAVAVSACSDDEEVVTQTHAYFADGYSTTVELDRAQTSFGIVVRRNESDRAVTVPLGSAQTTDGEAVSCFSIPDEVSFLAGEDSVMLSIGYEAEAVGYDVYYQLTLVIPDDYAASTVGSQATFMVVLPTPWCSLGMCSFTEDFLTTFFTFDPPTYEVELQESEVSEGHFRLVNVFGEAYPYSWEGEWDATTDSYLVIHAEDSDGVYIPLQDSGLTLTGYGTLTVGSLAAMYMDSGYSLEQVKALGLTGTYADGVITFPYRTLAVRLDGYSDDYYYANYNSAFRVEIAK